MMGRCSLTMSSAAVLVEGCHDGQVFTHFVKYGWIDNVFTVLGIIKSSNVQAHFFVGTVTCCFGLNLSWVRLRGRQLNDQGEGDMSLPLKYTAPLHRP